MIKVSVSGITFMIKVSVSGITFMIKVSVSPQNTNDHHDITEIYIKVYIKHPLF
jgi:hypothetical protein